MRVTGSTPRSVGVTIEPPTGDGSAVPTEAGCRPEESEDLPSVVFEVEDDDPEVVPDVAAAVDVAAVDPELFFADESAFVS